MPNTLKLYPNSSPGGVPIPLDVFWSLGMIPINGVAATAQNGISLGSPVPDFILVYAKVDCYIQFGADFSSAPAFAAKQGNGCIFVPANYPGGYVAAYNDEVATFSVWPLASGLIYVMPCSSWNDTRKTSQFARS